MIEKFGLVSKISGVEWYLAQAPRGQHWFIVERASMRDIKRIPHSCIKFLRASFNI